MDFMPGAIGLGDIIGGTLGVGIVPFPRVYRVEDTYWNILLVTITAGPDVMGIFDCGTVVAGDRVLVLAHMTVVKGGVGGNLIIRFRKRTGTASVLMYGHANTVDFNYPGLPAGSRVIYDTSAMVDVTGSGTLSMEFDGQSAGSNSTIQVEQLMMYGVVLAGS